MRYGKQSDDQILRKGCLQGERLAQEALYQRYYGKLLGIPMRYTGNREEARALLNQAFLKIFTSLKTYDERGSFVGWMSTITFRTTMDHLRAEQRYKKQFLLEEKEPKAVSNAIEEQLDTEDIFYHIQQLPDPLRVVFSMYVIDGYKHQEIADILDISLSTSKWRLVKARETLQAALGEFYNRKGKSL